MASKLTGQEIERIHSLREIITSGARKRDIANRSDSDIKSFLDDYRLKRGRITPHSKSFFGYGASKSNLESNQFIDPKQYTIYNIGKQNYLITQDVVDYFFNPKTNTPDLSEFAFEPVKSRGFNYGKALLSFGMASVALTAGLAEYSQSYIINRFSKDQIVQRLQTDDNSLTYAMVKWAVLLPALKEYDDKKEIKKSTLKIGYPMSDSDVNVQKLYGLNSSSCGSINGNKIDLDKLISQFESEDFSGVKTPTDLFQYLASIKVPYKGSDIKIISDDAQTTLDFYFKYNNDKVNLNSKLNRYIAHKEQPFDLFEISRIINDPKSFFKLENSDLQKIIEDLDYSTILTDLRNSVDNLDLNEQTKILQDYVDRDSQNLFEALLKSQNNRILPIYFSSQLSVEDLFMFKKTGELPIDISYQEYLQPAIKLKQYIESNTKLANFLQANNIDFNLDIEAIRENEVEFEQYKAFQKVFSTKLARK